MSGYNAEYGIPAGDRDNAEETTATPEPIVLTPEPEVVEPLAPWNVPNALNYYGSTWEPLTKEKADELVAEGELDITRLLATVRHLLWQNRRDIQADDHRLTHIWEQAAEIADRRGYCDVYDSIMEELGTGYAREVELCVTVTETVTYDVHVTAPRNADQRDIEELIEDIDLDDFSETDREREVRNWEISS